MFLEKDEVFIQKAINASRESVRAGGYPVGSVVVFGDKLISVGLSNGKRLCDPTLHAEIDAIRKACAALQTRSLEGATLYSSLEPCVMCFSASFWAYVDRIVYACPRASVSRDWYMGDHSIDELNRKNERRRLEIVHTPQFLNEALEVIREWEDIKIET